MRSYFDQATHQLKSVKRAVVKALPSKLRLWALRNQLNLKRLNSQDFSFQLATTTEELTAAYKLLHDCYVQEGYMKPNPSGLRCTIYHALPQSTVLVGKYKGRVVTTVTLFKDSPLGVPCDKDYSEENNRCRKKGFQLCEVSSLATHPDFRGGNMTFHLIKYLWLYSTDYLGATMLCCVVNPKAMDFYKGFLNFKQNGPEISYDFVEGAAGVHLTRELKPHQSWMEKVFNKLPLGANLYSFFYKETSPFQFPQRSTSFLMDPVLTPEMLNNFFDAKTDVFKNAKSSELSLVKSAYSIYFDPDATDWIPSSANRDRVFRYPTAIQAALSCEQISIFGQITDLSEGGFFFETSSLLDLNHLYDVFMNIDGQKFHFKIQLRWHGIENSKSGYGVRFLEYPTSLIQALRERHCNSKENLCRQTHLSNVSTIKMR